MCIYAEITKSGRFRCTHDIDNGEEEQSSSPKTKSCPYQKYCQKKMVWIHVNHDRCKFYKEQ